jgi:hypothetical protein
MFERRHEPLLPLSCTVSYTIFTLIPNQVEEEKRTNEAKRRP